MNRKSIIAGIAIAAASFVAFAESYEAYNPHFVSSASRAAVQAQVGQATDRTANPASISYDPFAQFRSGKTRAEVRAEYIASRGVVEAFTGEDSGSGYLAGRPEAAGATRVAAR